MSMMGAPSSGVGRRLPSDIMRAKWHLLVVLAAVALDSCGRVPLANPIEPPVFDNELIVATKEAPPFAVEER